MRLRVPYYAQSAEFSCGPACLTMALKYFDPSTRMGKSLEYDLWRECNMIGIRGADPFGLSVPLLKRGYNVTIISKAPSMMNKSQLKTMKWLSKEEKELTLFAIKDQKEKALSLGLKLIKRDPNLEDIEEALSENKLPIALVDMTVVHKLRIPHWVIVTGMNDEVGWINDPYPPKGKKNLRLKLDHCEKMMSDFSKHFKSEKSLLLVEQVTDQGVNRR